MLPIKKLPHASKLTVARLRLRRRAQLRTPISLKVNFSPSRPTANEEMTAAENAIPAIRSRAPAQKKVSASDVAPRAIAQPTNPTALNPVTSATILAWVPHWSFEFGARSFSRPSSNSSRAGCRACLCSASQTVIHATSTAATAPKASVCGST